MDPFLKQEEKVELFEGNDTMMIDLCIVCCSEVKVNCSENKDHLLSSNLKVIFLLMKVLQLPDYQMEENLRECGDPVNWISLCEQCSQLTGEAEELHWTIVRTNEQLRSVQQLILDKTKSPSPPLSVVIDKKTEWSYGSKNVWKRTRELISSSNYSACNLLNPFIEGDKLANYLQSQQYFSSEPEIKIEVDDSDDWQSHDLERDTDTDWEPPPENKSEEDQGTIVTSKAPPLNPKRSRRKLLKYEKVNGNFKCPSCNKVFGKRYNVQRHEMEKHPNVPNVTGSPANQFMRTCHLCSRKYSGQYELSVHLLSRHKDDPETIKLIEEKGYNLLKCGYPKCGVLKVNQTLMDKHIKRMHENSDKPRNSTPKKFPCQFCSRIFSQKDNLKRHQLVLHDNFGDDKPFKCDICAIGASSLEHLSAHMHRIHKIFNQVNRRKVKTSGNDDKPKQIKKKICHLCGSTCNSATAMKNHLVSKHKDDQLAKQLIEKGYGIWRCKVRGCSKKFTTKPGLDEHVQLKHGGNEDTDKLEMTCFCQFCGKGFFVEEALRKHEKSMHHGGGDSAAGGDGAKRFKCEFCGFGTQFQSYLDGHIRRVHKPNKKFGGEVKGEMVVICTVCGLQFWEKGKLERHMVIHDKEAEQPHPCDKCGRAFSTNESMWKHKRTVHKIYRRPDDRRIKR